MFLKYQNNAFSNMKTRVYYGEYTLQHWVKLMTTGNIELPAYQRSFVWEEGDVRRMLASLESGQFIPPVTLAHYEDGGESRNLILDGQQRLTSILLAYLGYMPMKEKFNVSEDDYAIGDDSDDEPRLSPIEWTYKCLLLDKPNDNTLDEIEKRIRESGLYHALEIPFANGKKDFYEKTFLGFSFVIPSSSDSGETQRYFSTLFRNMNYLGRKLSPLESRRSLYYLNADYKDFFDGKAGGKDVVCGMRILENMQAKKIDFVRYLSTISQLLGSDDLKQVLRGYSAYSSRESYYADYVSYIVGLEQEDRKEKFNGFKIKELFPNHEWRDRFVIVQGFLMENKNKLGLEEKNNAFTSWIDVDYWLFGLLYWVVFQGKRINNTEMLIKEISEEIKLKRTPQPDNDYSRNPNRVGNLRERIQRSIDIFVKYAE